MESIKIANGKTSKGIEVVVNTIIDDSTISYEISANGKTITTKENPTSKRQIKGKAIEVIQMKPSQVEALFRVEVKTVMLVKADYRMSILSQMLIEQKAKYAKQIEEACETGENVLISAEWVGDESHPDGMGTMKMYATPDGEVKKEFSPSY